MKSFRRRLKKSHVAPPSQLRRHIRAIAMGTCKTAYLGERFTKLKSTAIEYWHFCYLKQRLMSSSLVQMALKTRVGLSPSPLYFNRARNKQNSFSSLYYNCVTICLHSKPFSFLFKLKYLLPCAKSLFCYLKFTIQIHSVLSF